MKKTYIVMNALAALLIGMLRPTDAQTVNLWRGDAIDAVEETAASLVADATVDHRALAQALQNEKNSKTTTRAHSTDSILKPMQQTAGYIVFFGAVLLALRRPPEE